MHITFRLELPHQITPFAFGIKLYRTFRSVRRFKVSLVYRQIMTKPNFDQRKNHFVPPVGFEPTQPAGDRFTVCSDSPTSARGQNEGFGTFPISSCGIIVWKRYFCHNDYRPYFTRYPILQVSLPSIGIMQHCGHYGTRTRESPPWQGGILTIWTKWPISGYYGTNVALMAYT